LTRGRTARFKDYARQENFYLKSSYAPKPQPASHGHSRTPRAIPASTAVWSGGGGGGTVFFLTGHGQNTGLCGTGQSELWPLEPSRADPAGKQGLLPVVVLTYGRARRPSLKNNTGRIVLVLGHVKMLTVLGPRSPLLYRSSHPSAFQPSPLFLISHPTHFPSMPLKYAPLHLNSAPRYLFEPSILVHAAPSNTQLSPLSPRPLILCPLNSAPLPPLSSSFDTQQFVLQHTFLPSFLPLMSFFPSSSILIFL
jgi:hypothetical protein